MEWHEIRQQYPDQWLLIEALEAHTAADKRILDQLAVLDQFPDSGAALRRYQQLRSTAPTRELYVFHTSRVTLDITERRWLGMRGLQ